MNDLLTLSYYFNPRPGSDFSFTWVILGIGIVLILFGLVFEWRRKHLNDKAARKALRRHTQKPIWFGILALALLSFRELGIPFFSMRVWWFVLGILMIVSFIRFLRNYNKEYSQRKEQLKVSKKEDKYVPKKKKR